MVKNSPVKIVLKNSAKQKHLKHVWKGVFLFSKINSIYLRGMEGKNVTVEADVSDGLPGLILVGYLASEVREGGDRVRTAIKNLGLSLPPKKITINLSPADFRKEGTGFDLAIAAAILSAYGGFRAKDLKDAVLFGELGLDGTVRGIPGVMALTDQARESGFKRVFLPVENVNEASVIGGMELYGIRDLRHLLEVLSGKLPMQAESTINMDELQNSMNRYEVDFSELSGQPLLRRAAEVAAAGKHNLLIVGPAGAGKTMLAKRMPTIMPGLDIAESIEISKIYSVSHLLTAKEPLIRIRPFRAPHHTVSVQALTGGGRRPKPGEISLATGGILFLDEFPEFSRAALETLRQPLEEREVTVSRVEASVTYPANFQLVAAMNPCPCGHFPDRSRCRCTDGQITRYLQKVSGPMLDRIDICVEASPITYGDIRSSGNNESSREIRARVEQARKIQRERFAGENIRCNGEMSGRHIRKFCGLGREEEKFMEEIFKKLALSARMHDRILKVARTTADLAGEEKIRLPDLCEAVSYVKNRDKFWGN